MVGLLYASKLLCYVTDTLKWVCESEKFCKAVQKQREKNVEKHSTTLSFF